MLLPVSLCCAVSISSFMSFRNIPEKGAFVFFKMLGIGFAFFLILSVALYLYDCNISPRLKVQSLEMYWKVKNYSYPNSINSEFNKTPDFENLNAGTMCGRKLNFKLDSLREQQSKHINECNKLLALLPQNEADEAYESYKLEQLGVEYQYAQISHLEQDSLTYIQQVLLFEQADQLAESKMLVSEYHFESYKRSINAVCLLISYLVFATLGYILRNRSLTKILGVIAIIIVSAYLIYGVSNLTKAYLKQTLNIKERRY